MKDLSNVAIVDFPSGNSDCIEPGLRALLNKAKQGFATRRVDLSKASRLITEGVRPQAGDLVLVRVKRIRNHTKIELPSGRRAHIHVDDVLLMCYGNRYAPSQYEGFVPSDLGACQIAAAGGVVADVKKWNKVKKPPTEVEPIGLLADIDGKILNLRHFALPVLPTLAGKTRVISVIGTSMDAGKTTTLCGLVQGFNKSGLSVAAVKVTGTGSGGDIWALKDAGARYVFDFTDAGYASTYCVSEREIESITRQLIGIASAQPVDVVLVEVADGLLHGETWNIVQSDYFCSAVDGVVLAALDSMGALAGWHMLKGCNLNLIGFSGRLGSSPLGCEEVISLTGLPVFDRDDLETPEILSRFFSRETSGFSRQAVTLAT